MLTSLSRKPVLPQLCSSLAMSLGTQVYQNSSFAWLCATTSRKARSTFVGKVKALDSASLVVLRNAVPPVGSEASGKTRSAVLAYHCHYYSSRADRIEA